MSKVNQVAKENKGSHDHFKVSGVNSGVYNADGKLNVVAGDVNTCPKCLESIHMEKPLVQRWNCNST
jgi:hypothetical protein